MSSCLCAVSLVMRLQSLLSGLAEGGWLSAFSRVERGWHCASSGACRPVAVPCVSVVDDSSNWAVCGKSCGVISMPVAAQATHRVHMEVMPLFAGYLPLPDVRLFKYLPHHSAHSSQLDAGKGPCRPARGSHMPSASVAGARQPCCRLGPCPARLCACRPAPRGLP